MNLTEKKVFLLTLVALGCVQSAAAEEAKSPVLRVAVLDLKPQGVPKETVSTLNGIFLSGLVEGGEINLLSRSDLSSLLSLEETNLLVGCSQEDPRCVVQHGHALGNTILVWGSVGRVGDQMVINVAAVDVQAGSTIGRASRSVDADDGDDIVEATRELAGEIRATLGLSSPSTWQPIMAASIRLGGLMNGYLGNNGDIALWQTSFEAEGEVFILQQLAAFLQVGLVFAEAEEEAAQNQSEGYIAYYVPFTVGVKYRFIRPWLTPYIGLGAGLSFLHLNEEGGAFNAHVFTGMEFNPWERFGFEIEGGFVFSKYFDTKDLTQLGAKISVGVIYRF